jgi:hypothetical protein
MKLMFSFKLNCIVHLRGSCEYASKVFKILLVNLGDIKSMLNMLQLLHAEIYRLKKRLTAEKIERLS